MPPRPRSVRPLASAWLIHWEWVGEANRPPGDPVITVLSGRRADAWVCDFVEQIYLALAMGPEEKVSVARNAKNNPFPTMLGSVNGVPWSGQIFCGHNPWIFARKVRNVRVEIRDAERRVAWDELPPPTLPNPWPPKSSGRSKDGRAP
jgi:hypothetical protein